MIDEAVKEDVMASVAGKLTELDELQHRAVLLPCAVAVKKVKRFPSSDFSVDQNPYSY